jgi:hypothetical protein
MNVSQHYKMLGVGILRQQIVQTERESADFRFGGVIKELFPSFWSLRPMFALKAALTIIGMAYSVARKWLFPSGTFGSI